MSANPPIIRTSRFKIRIQSTAGSIQVNCTGKLTAEVAAEFKQEVRALIPQTKRVVLDLNDVGFIDSSGLGAIIGVYVTARKASCDLQLINLSKQVRDLLGMTKILSLFESAGQHGIRIV